MKNDDRLYTLDSLRGFAAIVVAIYHLEPKIHAMQRAGLLQPAPFSYEGPGYLAVDLFFCLSGYVIARSYAQRLRDGLSVPEFTQLRLIRLYPMYFLGYLLGIGRQLAGYWAHDPRYLGHAGMALAVLCGFFLLPTPNGEQLFPLNGPSWSLFFEIAINIAFALALYRANTKLVISLMVASVGVFLVKINPQELFNVGSNQKDFLEGLARTVYSFSAGMLLCRLGHLKPQATWACLLPITLMLFLLNFNVPLDWGVPWQTVAVVGLFPCIVALGVRFEAPPAARPLCSFLGEISYPLYALHWPCIALMGPLASRLHMTVLATHCMFIIPLLVLSYLAARLDTVVRARLTSLRKRRRQLAQA